MTDLTEFHGPNPRPTSGGGIGQPKRPGERRFRHVADATEQARCADLSIGGGATVARTYIGLCAGCPHPAYCSQSGACFDWQQEPREGRTDYQAAPGRWSYGSTRVVRVRLEDESE